MRRSRGTEKYARNFVPAETDNQFSAAALSPQSISCGRPRAQATGGQSPLREKALPELKFTLLGFSQRDWKSIPAKALTKRDCELVNITQHFTKIPRRGGCHEAHGAVRWSYVLTRTEIAEQTQTWNEDDWIDALCRSSKEIGMEYYQDQIGANIYIRAVNSHTQSSCYNQSTLGFFETDTVELEKTLHTGNSIHWKPCKIRHQDSGQSIGEDLFMNQEWYCASKAIVQIMIAFLSQSTMSSRRTFSITSTLQ